MLLLCFGNVTIMSYITIVTNVSVVNKKKNNKKNNCIASSLLIDQPPFVDFHSLLNKVTFKVLLEAVVGVSSSRPSCDVEATLPKADS